jgi:uncharacterized protein (DUF433 family)
MILNANPYVGVGLYSIPEAARLIGVPAATLRRWVAGSLFASREKSKLSEPRFRRRHPEVMPRLILTFADLIELYLMSLFRQHGVSLLTIQAIAKWAARELNSDHPLAAQRFHTEGKRLLAAMGEEAAWPGRFRREAPKSRLVLDKVALPFFEKLDYEGGQARRYWPLGPHKPVVLDPTRSFGKPIDNESGVPTSALYHLYRAGEPVERIACWYEVSPEAVQAAIEYEQSLAE